MNHSSGFESARNIGFLDQIVTQLSGGERQRVEICRSLLQIWPQLGAEGCVRRAIARA